jgi:hypothetical protein
MMQLERTIMVPGGAAHGDPVVGTLIGRPGAAYIYRVAKAVIVRKAGSMAYRVRASCVRVASSEVGPDPVIHSWRWDTSARAQRRPSRVRSADPGPGEVAGARMARIRAKSPLLLEMALEAIRKGRIADELARLAQVARVGQDNGIRSGRDHGPGIRLQTVRMRRDQGVLRTADVQIEDGPDPEKPNATVRRARRSDPLLDLLRARTISNAGCDAMERLRGQIEASSPAMPGGGASEVHVAAFQRTSISDKQIINCSLAREAMAAIRGLHRPVVLWVAVGGSLRGYAAHTQVSRAACTDWFKGGLERLVEHYRDC